LINSKGFLQAAAATNSPHESSTSLVPERIHTGTTVPSDSGEHKSAGASNNKGDSLDATLDQLAEGQGVTATEVFNVAANVFTQAKQERSGSNHVDPDAGGGLGDIMP